MTEALPAIFNQQPSAIEQQRGLTEQELLELGSAVLEAAQRPDLPEVVAEHTALSPNPNRVGDGVFIGGNVPTSPDRVYRQVGVEAVQDLAESGIVRNGRTANGTERRWGHTVFWHAGSEEGKHMPTGGRFVIEASKEAADKGWVTADQVKGIHTRMPDGSVANLLGAKR